MYEAYYGLSEKPFSVQPDPAYIYWGKGHRLAYTMLEYGVLSKAGITVVTGGIGCGKTTLIQHLLDQLSEGVTVAYLPQLHKNVDNLLSWVLMSLNQPYDGLSEVAMMDKFERYLRSQHAKGKRTVLVIDEAQNLGVTLLEELRLLSNFNVGSEQLLQLILCGQPQLKTLLRRPELVQFAQRVSSDYHIKPLETEEVREYIEARLSVAGRTKKLFSQSAIEAVAKWSGGVPRMINIICDTALVYGFAGDWPVIDAKIIDQVIEDKTEHGVFAFGKELVGGEGMRTAFSGDGDELPAYQVGADGDEPALVIHDKKLAQYLVEQAKQRK